jgi:gluconolactonase
VLVVTPGGAVAVASTAVPGFTNGLAFSPDGAWLHVAESAAGRVTRMAVAGTELGEPELVVAFERAVPDGLAFTADGLLLVSCYRPDAVFAVRDTGLETIAEDWQGIALSAPTNLAFFGDGLERLVAANLQGAHLTELPSPGPGAPLHRPTGLA